MALKNINPGDGSNFVGQRIPEFWGGNLQWSVTQCNFVNVNVNVPLVDRSLQGLFRINRLNGIGPNACEGAHGCRHTIYVWCGNNVVRGKQAELQRWEHAGPCSAEMQICHTKGYYNNQRAMSQRRELKF